MANGENIFSQDGLNEPNLGWHIKFSCRSVPFVGVIGMENLPNNVLLVYKFRKRAKEGLPIGSMEPLASEAWFDLMVRKLNSMAVPIDQWRISLTASMFMGDVDIWCRFMTNIQDVEVMTWEEFKTLFFDPFFLRVMRQDMRVQFTGLYQGMMSVIEYKTCFTSLSRYALEMVATDELRARKFQDGLHLDIRPQILVLNLRTYGEVVQRAMMVEWKKAKARDSSRVQGQSQQARSAPTIPVSSGKVIYHHCLEVMQRDGFLYVNTPVSGLVSLNVYRGCAIEIAGQTLEFDFVIFDMTGFDVILGMDWLSFFHASIDCFHGRVSICTPTRDCFHFMRDRSDSHSKMTFSISDWSRHRSFLASLLADEGSSLGRAFLAVANEFLDVFPKELAELPPLWEVVFAIDVILGTAPISMALYRMAPADEVAYRLALSPDFDKVHEVFHVSKLRKYELNPLYVLRSTNVVVNEDVTYEEGPVQILNLREQVHQSADSSHQLNDDYSRPISVAF
ncbi:uncharacterized protein LOC132301740 [Cornus florida]|uniref:uncharacterized protein LOC132301740 n=1 Tax=Cornus florida TaxID=4283 RepID=UPI00289EA2B8|nr:uncharacterized protein LOC132301740 [Cornus florida]